LRHAARTVVIVVLLAVAGCGNSDESSSERGEKTFERVFASVKGLEGKERQRKLQALAEREGGKLSLYTSLLPGVEVEVAEAFKDAFDVEVSVFRSTGETIAQRVSEEGRANFRGTDVVELSGIEMSALREEDLLVPYRPAAASGLVNGSLQDGWTATRFNKFAVSWNEKRLPGDRGPRSVEELARPAWKGLVAMEAGDADWYKTLREHWIEDERMSAAEADRRLESMARNARVVNGHALMTELLVAGEFAVAPSAYSYQTRNAIEKGAPLAAEPTVEPVISRPQGVGLLTTAEHPATAVLFVEWLLGDGQEVLREHDADVSRKDLASDTKGELLVDVAAFVDERREWDERYERLIGLGEEVDGGG
jgi:iron(III) transport system substrate-binding protein